MRDWWLPLLISDDPPKEGPERKPPSVLSGFGFALMRIADPVKLTLYGSLIAVLAFFGYIQPRQATTSEFVARLVSDSATHAKDRDYHLELDVAATAMETMSSSSAFLPSS